MSEELGEKTVLRAVAVSTIQRQAHPHVLELVRGPGAPQRFLLDRPALVLGRANTCDLHVESSELSRKHMALSLTDNEFTCQDLESRNGIFLNGVKIHSAVLRHGDTLQLGDLLFVYHEGR